MRGESRAVETGQPLQRAGLGECRSGEGLCTPLSGGGFWNPEAVAVSLAEPVLTVVLVLTEAPTISPLPCLSLALPRPQCLGSDFLHLPPQLPLAQSPLWHFHFPSSMQRILFLPPPLPLLPSLPPLFLLSYLRFFPSLLFLLNQFQSVRKGSSL